MGYKREPSPWHSGSLEGHLVHKGGLVQEYRFHVGKEKSLFWLDTASFPNHGSAPMISEWWWIITWR